MKRGNNMSKILNPCWIVSTPRSGTTYFCDLINNTDLFNPFFEEHFNLIFGNRHQDFSDRSNEFMFCKIQPMQWEFNNLELNFVKEKLNNIKFIRIKRKNIIDKAVSLYLASISNIWNISEDIKNVKLHDKLQSFISTDEDYLSKEFKLDLKYLIKCYHTVIEDEEKCDRFLENVNSIEIDYEEIINDNSKLALDKFFEYMNISFNDVDSLLSKSLIKKMPKRFESEVLKDVLKEYHALEEYQ